jgi:hypothetical protein
MRKEIAYKGKFVCVLSNFRAGLAMQTLQLVKFYLIYYENHNRIRKFYEYHNL